MSILAWIIVGLVSGFIASHLVDHRGRGLVLDLVLGIVGAAVGGSVFRFIGSPGVTGFNLWSVFVAIIGAVLVLALARMFTRPRCAT